MWTEEACESGYEVNIATVRYRKCLLRDVTLIYDQANRLGPFDSGTGDFNSTFKSVLCFIIQTIADCCQQTICREHWLISNISQDEAASTVSCLYFSRLKHMSETGRLLITKNTSDGNVGELGALVWMHGTKVI